MILLDVSLAALPGEQGALAMLLRDAMALSLAEPGCLIYRFTRDLDDADRFHLVELWEDEAALSAHLAGPVFQAFRLRLPLCGRVLSSVARSGTLTPYELKRPAVKPTDGD